MSFISQTSLSQATPDILIPGLESDGLAVAGNWVRMNGSGLLVRALADTSDNANVFGLVEEVSGTRLTVRVAGVSKSLFIGLDRTKEYLLSSATPGGMNPEGVSVPSLSGNVVLVLGKPMDATRFLVRVGSRMIRS